MEKICPALRLRSSVPLKIENGEAIAEFKLRARENGIVYFGRSGWRIAVAKSRLCFRRFKETMNFWLAWVGRSKYRGRWREMVNRSALTLKLLTSATTRLDCRRADVWPAGKYRRRAQLGLSLHMDSRRVVHALCADAAGLHGRSAGIHALDGKTLPRIETGQAAASDVSARRAARIAGTHPETFRRLQKILSPCASAMPRRDQLQLDIYGELMDSVFIYDKHGEPISYDFWMNIVTLIEWVCKNWRKPDEGIWEVRGGARPFLYSRAMCWIAIDRAMQLARRRSFPAPLVRWHKIRDEIYTNIYQTFWNPKLKSFVQFHGAKTVDAAVAAFADGQIHQPDRSALEIHAEGH